MEFLTRLGEARGGGHFQQGPQDKQIHTGGKIGLSEGWNTGGVTGEQDRTSELLGENCRLSVAW